jgi:kinetochore protein Nuf2
MMEGIEYPELHEQSFPKLVMMGSLIKVMRTAQIMDFSLQDMIKPTSKRLKNQLSALINFAKFRAHSINKIDDAMAVTDELRERNEDAKLINADMDRQLEEMAAANAAEEPVRLQLVQENEGLKDKIRGLHAHDHQFQQQLRVDKDTMTEIVDVVAKKDFEIMDLKKACKLLQGKIVQSPELLKQEIQRLGAQLAEEKENVKQKEQMGRELVVRVESMTDTKSEIAKARNALYVIEGEIGRLNATHVKTDQITDAVVAQQRQLKESKAKEQQMKRQTDIAGEKLNRLSAQQSLKRQTAQESLEVARKNKAALEKEGSSARSEAKETSDTRARFQAKLDARSHQHQLEMDELREQHLQLISQMGVYHNGITQAMTAAC